MVTVKYKILLVVKVSFILYYSQEPYCTVLVLSLCIPSYILYCNASIQSWLDTIIFSKLRTVFVTYSAIVLVVKQSTTIRVNEAYVRYGINKNETETYPYVRSVQYSTTVP